MSNLIISGGRRLFRAGLLLLAAALTSLAGCDRPSAGRLVVATSWPVINRRRLASEFQSWVAASHGNLEHRRIRLDWLILEPRDDLARVVERRDPPDVLLGGSASSFARLARTDQLAPIDSTGSVLWSVGRRVSKLPSDGSFGSGPSHPGDAQEARRDPSPRVPAGETRRTTAVDDPRQDPIFLALALEQLDHGQWREGYARLIRAAGSSQPIVLPAEAAGDNSRRGAAKLAGTSLALLFPPPRVDYLAVPRTARNQELARGFLRFLAEKHGLIGARSPAETAAGADPDFESMVADLLGATLVDAHDELAAAWKSLERAGYPERLLHELTKPPPWPPASVAKYLGRDGERAMSLIETLAVELAPEPPARAWLLRSWLSPLRIVDDKLFYELARAEHGRLGHEPRFRAWLRAEWTAWARQRYRRVARMASIVPSRVSKERSPAAP